MGFGRFEMRVSDAEIPSSEVRFRNAKAQITISSLKVRNWMFQISISVFELFPRTLRGNSSTPPGSNSEFQIRNGKCEEV